VRGGPSLTGPPTTDRRIPSESFAAYGEQVVAETVVANS